MIEFNCPKCGEKIMAPDDSEGASIKCLGCKSRVAIPEGTRKTTIVWLSRPFTTGGWWLFGLGVIVAVIGLLVLFDSSNEKEIIRSGFISVIGTILLGVGFLSRRHEHKS